MVYYKVILFKLSSLSFHLRFYGYNLEMHINTYLLYFCGHFAVRNEEQ